MNVLSTMTSTGKRERALRCLADLPPFSPVLNLLLATIASEDAPVSAIAEVIQKDTVIAGNILKLVNSAMYGRRSTVTSIPHAASLLGLNRLRNAVLGMSVSRMWNQVRTPALWSTARFNLHSVGAAIFSDLLAQRLKVEFPEGAFLAGLFHDIGKLLIAVGLPGEYEEIQSLHLGSAISSLDAEREVLGFTHCELSADAVQTWRLAEAIRAAVEYHHLPAKDTSSAAPGTYRLSAVVRCADVYVECAGINVEREREFLPEQNPHLFSDLGIDNQSPALIEEFEAEYQALASFFR
jgi:HD-like signal output (HDOD) protein